MLVRPKFKTIHNDGVCSRNKTVPNVVSRFEIPMLKLSQRCKILKVRYENIHKTLYLYFELVKFIILIKNNIPNCRQMQHPLYAVRNGPLGYLLSQMGRIKSERVHKERVVYRTQATKPRITRKSHPDTRVSGRKRPSNGGGGHGGMDLLRGVYTLAQVILF